MLLVTGGTGFIGRAIVSHLGGQVRLLARDVNAAREAFPKAEVVKGNILDSGSLDKAMRDVDQVVHLAGEVNYQLSREEVFRINDLGTRNVLNAAQEADRFVFASSVSVYGETTSLATEQTLPKPRTWYGESKLAAERAVEAAAIPSVSLRIGVVFGIGSPIWMNIMRFFSKGFPIPRSPTKTNVVHVSDVARAFAIALEKGKGIYNVASKHSIPFIELASLLSYHMGLKPKFWPVWLVRLLAKSKGKLQDMDLFITNREYSIEKAEQELGWTPEAYLEKELKAMVEWYKEQV